MRGSGRGGEGAILCQPSPRRRVECVCHSDCVSAEMQQGVVLTFLRENEYLKD